MTGKGEREYGFFVENLIHNNKNKEKSKSGQKRPGFFWSGTMNLVCLNAKRQTKLTAITLSKGDRRTYYPAIFINI